MSSAWTRTVLRTVARTGRSIVWLPGDLVNSWRHPLRPPRRLGFVGPGDFEAVGNELMEAVVTQAGLLPHHDVLDLGSGNGRLAVPLTRYLDGDGSYQGIDVVRSGVRWCNRHIASRFAQFDFAHVDTHHPMYNPRGRAPATTPLPFADDRFDIVVLSSVFTHLLPGQARHMLGEVARMLRPDGVLFSTWFALDDVADVPVGADFTFDAVDVDHAIGRRDLPHSRVAYRRGWINDELARVGLTAVEPMRDGRWRASDGGPQYQDAVVARFPG